MKYSIIIILVENKNEIGEPKVKGHALYLA